MKKNTQIAVIGDGGWGTTLAIHLCEKGFSVKLWGAFPDYVKRVQKTRNNTKFLPDIKIPKRIQLTSNLKEAISQSDLIVLATPSQYIRSVLLEIKKCPYAKKSFLSVIKGIDNTKLIRISQLIHATLGNVPLAILSGPTIAGEVALKIPSTAVIACHNPIFAKKLQEIFNSQSFRIYTNSDMIGVELGGSIKNIIAIACGVCDGLGFGSNTKSAILCRGLAEMARLGEALGAQKHTFFGLSGLGDLATTCFSPQSRNRQVGEALGKGKTIKQILASRETVAEGVPTVKAVYKLSRKHRINMPITTEVFRIIYKKKNPRDAVKDLMTRKLKSE
ncbi:MAG: NAD(P)H-dependent glycerol-3-phosphate dehydrogenase [Candidatus Omnitrophota bacterium]